MKRLAWFLALVALAPSLALSQARPPSQRTGPIQITGEGSTGPISDMSVAVPYAGAVKRSVKASVADPGVYPDQFRDPAAPDDTAAFQAAAATKRLIRLKDGATYTVCAAIPIWKGVVGQATVKPCAVFVVPRTNAFTNVVTGAVMDLPQQPLNSIFYNANYLATTPTDDGLVFRDFTIDARGSNIALVEGGGAEFHLIKVRMARNVLVENVTCWGSGICTAFQADDVTTVRASRAYGFINSGFDHWEGPTNATVENSIAVCGPRRSNGSGGTIGADGGVMFTGSSTTYQDRQGFNVMSRNNKISGGCNAGVFVNALSPGSSITNANSDHDTIDAAGNASMIGIVFDGNIQSGNVNGTLLKNGTGSAAVVARADIIATNAAGTTFTTSGKPARINFTGVSIQDWTTAPGNLSPLVLYGYGHTVSGLSIFGGTNNTFTTAENSSISISGTFAGTSTFGALNCLGGCTTPGITTVIGATPPTTVR